MSAITHIQTLDKEKPLGRDALPSRCWNRSTLDVTAIDDVSRHDSLETSNRWGVPVHWLSTSDGAGLFSPRSTFSCLYKREMESSEPRNSQSSLGNLSATSRNSSNPKM